MTEKVLETIINAFVKELIIETKELFGDAYDEAKQFIGKGLKEYLEKQKSKYAHIKTLLKGNTPVFLYEIYYPLFLSSEEAIINTDNISNIFKTNNYVTIIGDAGSGKSTLSKHLFLNAIKEKYGIPILIELRYLNETDGDIQRYITERIFENKLAENSKILERLLHNGKFVFFLDGFDELNVDVKNKLIKSLISFVNCNEKNKFILTSRPYSNIENFPAFKNCRIQQLDKKKGEIDGFIDHQLRKEKELADKIKKSLKGNKSEFIQSFLTNPLLLTLYILTFQTNAEIPNKRYIFYRRVINALFSEHDSKTKLGYVREKQTKLSQEQFEDVLKAFCFVSYFEQRYDYDYDYVNLLLQKIKEKAKYCDFENRKFIQDLKSAIALWTEDNGIYSFAHRSLQEYFAALFLKNLNNKDKERAYKKIIEKFGQLNRAWGVENFLSLCSEMDEINYSTQYLLPMLKEIKSCFDPSDENTITMSFVKFFAKSITFSNHHNRISVRPEVYKSLYIHLYYTQKLYECLSRINNGRSNTKERALKTDEKKKVIIVRIDNEISEDFKPLILTNTIKQLSNEFYNFINEKIDETEKYIESVAITDRELLDLI